VSLLKRNQQRQVRRSLRVRKKIRSRHDNNKVRITVFRSLNHIYGQAIDDLKGNTIASSSSMNIEKKGDKKTFSFDAGKELGAKLLSLGVKEAIFDRGSYLYHGRVRSFVEGLRQGGLII